MRQKKNSFDIVWLYSSPRTNLESASTKLNPWQTAPLIAHALSEKPLKCSNTVCLQMNGAVSKVNRKFISHLTRAQRTPSAAATVQVSHALPAVRFSCLLRGCGASLQDGVAAGKGFL